VAKVAVYSHSTDLDPYAWCREVEGSERHERLREDLGVEHLNFVVWSDDLHELACAALFPLDPAAVCEIWETRETNEVWLDVQGVENASVAIGKLGCNIRAANRLLDRRLMVVCTPATQESDQAVGGASVQNALVLSALRNAIPQISSGEVQVMGIGFVPGATCWVAVEGRRGGTSPVGVCVGRDGERAKAIRSALGVQQLVFAPWDPNPCWLLSSVYANLRLQVESVEEGEGGKIVVRLPSGAQAGPVFGTGRRNHRAAEALTGRPVSIVAPHATAEEPEGSAPMR
jgi:transcription antitermination factor NusA-like protein